MVNQLFNQLLFHQLPVVFQILLHPSMRWVQMVSPFLEKMESRFRFHKFWVQMGNLRLTHRRDSH